MEVKMRLFAVKYPVLIATFWPIKQQTCPQLIFATLSFIFLYMTISYNWLSEYLPNPVDPQKLSKILTAVGLEVESLEKQESIKGGLTGLVIGEVKTCEKHPDADKLSLTTVNVGGPALLQIVCGASNVAVGQKVLVAPVGTTIFPIKGEPVTMKKAKIRGVESQGMICAEDEIGLSDNHAGILILPADLKAGMPAADFFKPETDWIYEIGLTPNRMDAMSHLGVARDVCAYLAHHEKLTVGPKSSLDQSALKLDDPKGPSIEVIVENPDACHRYSGVYISGITVAESPAWLLKRLKSIGLRPINNIVDITNFILHETGQPLHAFDADQIGGGKVLVKNLAEGTVFVSLDEKERKLSYEDLMICDGNGAPMCIGGVFGGLHSGVTSATQNVFLESAWFHPVSIRKSSVRHGLRTDAATRFEKGVDISQTAAVLKRAALLIKEIAGGTLTGKVVDVYPNPAPKREIALKYHYMKKLSGKNYHPDAVKRILGALGFVFIKEGADDLWFSVPYHKPDITLQADLVEEIMRIDGLDHVEIPTAITLSPSADVLGEEERWREKMANLLVGSGYHEIFTNSITNSKYYPEENLATAVKMINNLSADLDIMRPAMMETVLETVAFNLNRKNRNLRLFEFGKTYQTKEVGSYHEEKWLVLAVTGAAAEAGWRNKEKSADLFYLKGIVANLLAVAHAEKARPSVYQSDYLNGFSLGIGQKTIATIGEVSRKRLQTFDIKQPVWYAAIQWDNLLETATKGKVQYSEIPRYPSVDRDLALLVNTGTTWQQMADVTTKARVPQLQKVQLFDVFESEKLGPGKQSMALSLRFQDNEKTMTDTEIDAAMQKIAGLLEQELNAEVRK
jgi:phenylalanyl-tRNA synthetase beta chain